DAEKPYYFSYSESDDDGRTVNAISVRLFTDAKKKKTKPVKEEKKNYETVEFGQYIQDKEGKGLSPLSWRVLDKKDGMALLVTEKIIDHIRFSVKGNNNWEKSDILKWLNKDFADRAFSKQEKSIIEKSVSGKKVFILSLDEYNEYFSSPEDARAGYTDSSRKITGDDHHTKIREPYGFWWLRTASNYAGLGGKSSVYVYHVCNNGTVNPFERAASSDGVRPAIWVKADAVLK
ncbi:MAG: hypothetical protein II777_02755, partial [Clostridia bacterium]|nr:hypothetical protein [Clostridia bacterium]